MADNLDFSADEFHKMSHEERLGLCRKLAERARALARLAGSDHREAYLRIAWEWDNLTQEMKRLD